MAHPLPLTALRTFESAARHCSFKLASIELGVTPSAVSRSVQSLENYLETKLFHRRTRAIILTDAGKLLLGPLREGLRSIQEGVDLVKAQQHADILTVSCAPSLARVWLMPRLSSFLNQTQGVETRLISSSTLADFENSEADLSILYNQNIGEQTPWPGLMVEPLLEERLVPACSPKLLAGSPPLKNPEELLLLPLLHTETKATTWEVWFKRAGIKKLQPTKSIRFNRSTLAIEAALAGLGVVLESETLIRTHINDGTLMVPLDLSISGPEAGGYFLIYPAEKERLPKFQVFRKWVLAEATSFMDE
ncbi:MAG: LysR family transcriptional regulator [Magnetococcales bacterium]|nr:LysR family transcriptional regulator [Magnetococcales bacterium]